MSKSRPAGAKKITIVAIGASAGGLEAVTALLKKLQPDTGLAFVLVQHLDPQHESVLTQILGRATSMPVREVTNNLRVQANHFYVIPPNAALGVSDGILKLQPRGPAGGKARSIDSFFEALAEDQHQQAIGIILSGTGSDGTLGLEAIKAEGGITFAQDSSAKYDSMPASAIAAGCVDFVLNPEKIANELARIAKHPYVAGESYHDIPLQNEEEAKPTDKPEDDGFKSIVTLLRNHCGVDFSRYKSSTIQRRILRRMVLNKEETLQAYAKALRGNAKELEALFSDVLISVTSFFRNPEAFDVLKNKVFPALLQHNGGEALRVWVPGCSTGQEAYSIAMTYLEATDKTAQPRKLEIFATDLNEAVLAKARQGFYAKALVQDIAPARLRRFFVEEADGYRVSKAIREMVIFARQNLVSQPPFSRLDLISCRNLLIYLDAGSQKKVFPIFHYALNPDGFLFLGASESPGHFADLFETVDRKQKIYSRKDTGGSLAPQRARMEWGGHPAVDEAQRVVAPSSAKAKAEPTGFRSELSAEREADRLTVNLFAPPGVLINAQLQILQFRGVTSPYLEPPTGKASFDLLKMAREGLLMPLRAVINKAKKENQTARKENVQVKLGGKIQNVNLEVVPLKNLHDPFFLVLFINADKAPRIVWREPETAKVGGRAAAKKTDSHRIAELERELSETREYLQSIQEQYEAANEELNASNEEGQSANEELQSLNEELETSKEELESANEELTTVNEEMANRNSELFRLNNDTVNLETSTKLSILLLGHDLRIRRFSAQAEKQFNLLAGDVGLSLSAMRHNLFVSDPLAAAGEARLTRQDTPFHLEGLIRDVIDAMREQEREAFDKEGRWYSLRARPYVTFDKKIDGAVLVLMDITDLKRTQQEVDAARDRARLHMNELAHRAKNLLAVVQLIATRSLSGSRTLAEANEVFAKRIQALARSQTAVTAGLEGGNIAEFIRLESAGFSERIRAVGPPVMLSSKAAQTFSLLVHELATNAMKYGALSTPAGNVEVEWRVEGVDSQARLKFRWSERGGPPVNPPSHSGFGRTLIELAVEHEFGAQSTLRFDRSGVCYEFDARLAALTDEPLLTAKIVSH